MDIKIIKDLKPKIIPETPKEVVDYLMLTPESRAEFNDAQRKINPMYWAQFDNSSSQTPGFFSIIRGALHFNSAWVEVLNEEMRKLEHRENVRIIADKIKEFYGQLYVGPMIGALPYFRQWAIPEECVERKTVPAWTD